MDRLQALLNGRTPKVKDPVSVDKVNHATERARLNNEDRKYNRIVYDNEVKQANLYNQSVMPDSGKDIGVGFKVNVYIIKLTQLLGLKGELDKTLTNYFAQGVSVQKLRGTTREAQVATEFFKKGDILATFNELMLYIKTYAQDIITDDAFKSQIYNSSFNPLIQIITDTAKLYPDFFQKIPPPTNVGQPTEDKAERKIYETAREQSVGCYSLLNTMADFLNNSIFRPITKEDVGKYIKDNNVASIFTRNPQAPQPLPPPPPQQPPPEPLAPLFPIQPAPTPPLPTPPVPLPGTREAQEEQRQREQQGQPQPPPPPQQAPPNVNDDAYITGLVEGKETELGRFLFVKGSQDVANIIQEVQQANPALTGAEAGTLAKNITAKIKERRRDAGLPVQGKETQASLLQSTQAYQTRGQQAPAPQQGQQGQPAGFSLRAIGENVAPITETANVWNAMDAEETYGQNGMGLNQQELNDLRAVVRDTIAVIKRLEDARGGIYRAKTPADVREVLDNEAQATTANLDRLIPDEQDRISFIEAVIDGMRDVRIEFRDIEAQDQNRPDFKTNKDERTLYGLGRERNNDLIHNAVLDFENMARRQAKETDKDTIMEIFPHLKGLEPKLRFHINQMRRDRINEPNMWGKGKHEYKQGLIKRAGEMPLIMEFDPKAEALKKGKIMSGGCDTCMLRGGMDNREWRYSGYGEVANEEDTPFKRMLGGMPNPFAPKTTTQALRPLLPYNASFDEEDDRDYYNEVLPEEGSHYAELEKPVDLDDFADAIRKNNENYKVATGKMKSVKYRN